MIAFLTGKLAGPLFGAAALALLVFGAVQTIRIEGMPLFGGGYRAEVAELHDRIENPKTGYIHNLDVAEGNVLGLRTAIGEQNGKIEALAIAGQRLKDEAQRNVDAARAKLAAAQRRMTALLSSQRRPGETACAHASRLIDEAIR